MNGSNVRVESPDYRRATPLSQEQTIALVAAVRDVIQRETCSAEEAAGIALAVTATFCMDFNGDDVELMAKQLQQIKNRIVSDFRLGKWQMTKGTPP